MLISSKKLIGLDVVTKSGEALGSIRDFDVDADSLRISKLYVRSAGIVKGLVSGDLIISAESIISIEEEKVMVEDLMEGELALEGTPVG